jgi:hypothetical protein
MKDALTACRPELLPGLIGIEHAAPGHSPPSVSAEAERLPDSLAAAFAPA